MYALSPRALGIHIRQITRAYVTTITCKLVCTHVTVLLLIALPDHDLINYYILFVSYYSQYNVFILHNQHNLIF